jgi:Ca2+-binding EF-hand superfamily protein
MNKSKTSLIVACGLALSALPSALANDAEEKFKMMDTNSDGRVSREEHAAGAHAKFGKLDANSDGIVTTNELDAGHSEKKSSKLKFWEKDDKKSAEKASTLDLNADGQITRAEHESATVTLFARLDANNDGYLSKDECEKEDK